MRYLTWLRQRTMVCAQPPTASPTLLSGLHLDIHAAFEYAATAERITLTSADHQEGVQAFREKRSPQFHGY